GLHRRARGAERGWCALHRARPERRGHLPVRLARGHPRRVHGAVRGPDGGPGHLLRQRGADLRVPEYSDITSIDELPDHVDELQGRVVGIEPGAGHTEVTENSVFPEYGLGDAGFTLATSSTSTMLTELGSAIDAEEPIVVTLWRPVWANAAYPVRDLEDPKDALGESEGLHFLAYDGFSEEYPEIADWIGQIHLDDDQYGAMEEAVVVDNEDDPAAGIEQFLEENPDVIPDFEG